MKYQRILVKLSGEALSGDGKNGILDSKALLNTAKAIADIVKLGAQVGIVIGAGNIARGSLLSDNKGIDRVTGDKMGMLGTIINSFAMMDTLKSLGVKAVVLSAVKMEQFTETYSPELAEHYLSEGYAVVYGGGTGKPFFTTDTCATLRAIETKCDAIFMAKNGVDGIYNDDPRKNKNAKMYKSIKCSEIIAQNLKVMDLTAVEMLKNQDIDVRVFNMSNSSSFARIVNGEDVGTTIMKG
ncbi:MAG: UMP kinase [Bacilli bacterium]|nr:UMP kinase [Bacilli bacterium]